MIEDDLEKEKKVLQDAGFLCEICKEATQGSLCNDCSAALDRIKSKSGD